MVLTTKNTHRKYANAKSYHTFKGDELQGIFPVEWKMTEKELKSFLLEILTISGADRIILHWTALEGVIDEEVKI